MEPIVTTAMYAPPAIPAKVAHVGALKGPARHLTNVITREFVIHIILDFAQTRLKPTALHVMTAMPAQPAMYALQAHAQEQPRSLNLKHVGPERALARKPELALTVSGAHGIRAVHPATNATTAMHAQQAMSAMEAVLALPANRCNAIHLQFARLLRALAVMGPVVILQSRHVLRNLTDVARPDAMQIQI